MKKNRKRRLPAPEPKRQKKNPLTAMGVETVDYKDTQLLRTFISERGKIRSRRVTGLTPQHRSAGRVGTPPVITIRCAG